MKTYAFPLALWISAVLGLVLMLLADGLGEHVGLLLSCLPLAAVARYALVARS